MVEDAASLALPDAPSPPPAAIETHDLTKRFGGRRAVDSVTIRVPQGVIAGLVGPNGAGVLPNLVRTKQPFDTRDGRRHRDADIAGLLETVSLADRAKHHVGSYSLGMKQRLGIAAALLSNPELLLLD